MMRVIIYRRQAWLFCETNIQIMLFKKSGAAAVPSCEECTTRSESMFCSVDLPSLEKMSGEKSSSIYRKGQTIFYEDRQPHGVYCIYSGKVKIHKYGENGQEQIVRFARAGSLIGYRALLNGIIILHRQLRSRTRTPAIFRSTYLSTC
jgi:CRP-like cAMP-binding protein